MDTLFLATLRAPALVEDFVNAICYVKCEGLAVLQIGWPTIQWARAVRDRLTVSNVYVAI